MYKCYIIYILIYFAFQVRTEYTNHFTAVDIFKTDRLHNNTWHILGEIKGQ